MTNFPVLWDRDILIAMVKHGLARNMLLGLFIGALISSGLLVVAHVALGGDGQMGSCPLMPGVAVCNLTPFQHMAGLQSLSNALPQVGGVFSLMILLLLSIAIAVTLVRNTHIVLPMDATKTQVIRQRPVPLLRLLQEAFSNGIIHSKAF